VAKFNRDLLAHHRIFATGTTGLLLEKELRISITKFQSGPLGGDQQIGAASSRVKSISDFLLGSARTATARSDVKALSPHGRGVDIPTACDRATADFIISSPLMDKPYDRLVPDYDIYRHRKVPRRGTPPLPIPGVTGSVNPALAAGMVAPI